jgi:hypothetical protein
MLVERMSRNLNRLYTVSPPGHDVNETRLMQLLTKEKFDVTYCLRLEAKLKWGMGNSDVCIHGANVTYRCAFSWRQLSICRVMT